MNAVTVVGAGLAGSEAAYQLAIRGIPPLPTLVIAILVGVVCAFVIQDGMTVKGMFSKPSPEFQH